MQTLHLNNVLTSQHVASLTPKRDQEITDSYRQATKRVLMLDYDGVLVPFRGDPHKAKPSAELLKTLTQLAGEVNTEIVIVSGRKRADLINWFGQAPVNLVAEHGVFTKRKNANSWYTVHTGATRGWQHVILPILERYARKTPGALVEVKETSLVWHYRKANPYHAQKYLVILKHALKPVVKKLGLEARQGNMILEVKPTDSSKGNAVLTWLKTKPDFVLVIGDDYTDEDMFTAMPTYAFTVKVGRGRTGAQLRAKNIKQVLGLLQNLMEI